MHLSRAAVFAALLTVLWLPVAALAETLCCSCTPPNGTAQCLTIDQSKLTSKNGACGGLPAAVGDSLKGWSCSPNAIAPGACIAAPQGSCPAAPVDAFAAQAPGDVIRPKTDAAKTADDAQIVPRLNTPIPGFAFVASEDANNPLLSQYIAGAYRYLISISAVAATIVFTYGAFMYLLGGAVPSISSGKRIMQDAVIGMLLVLSATAILRTINPQLTRLNTLNVTPIVGMQLKNESVLSPDTAIDPTGSAAAKPTKGAFLAYNESRLTGLPQIPVAPGAVAQPLTVPEFKQFSGPWANQAYGPSGTKACPGTEDRPFSQAQCCTTYARAACGAASLAELLAANNIGADPGRVGAALVSLGARSCNNGTSFSGNVLQKFNASSSFNADLIALGTGFPAVESTASALRSGQPVMFMCGACTGQKKDGTNKSYPGHYMVLTGVDPTGRIFTVSDVGSSNGIVNILQSELTTHSGGFWTVKKH